MEAQNKRAFRIAKLIKIQPKKRTDNAQEITACKQGIKGGRGRSYQTEILGGKNSHKANAQLEEVGPLR